MAGIRAIVTDVEGTTTPVRFVMDTLFPYARARLPEFLRRHAGEPAVAACLDETRRLADLPDGSRGGNGLDEVTAVLIRWIDEDRKATPLKTLQGLIWADGYAGGALAGDVYDDAAARLREWHRDGLRLYGYSSGSTEAQRLLFGHSRQGDLAVLFDGFFDTRLGGKLETASYAALADRIGLPGPAILFLSDNERELDAARDAGLQTARLARDGEPEGAVPAAESRHAVHRSFTTIDP
jgi:enolase-phosphatase E1